MKKPSPITRLAIWFFNWNKWAQTIVGFVCGFIAASGTTGTLIVFFAFWFTLMVCFIILVDRHECLKIENERLERESLSALKGLHDTGYFDN